MLSTKSKHIKTTTVAGQRCKISIYLVKTEDDDQIYVIINKYVLSDEIREDFKNMHIVKEYKGKYLYFVRMGYKLETYCEMIELIHDLL